MEREYTCVVRLISVIDEQLSEGRSLIQYASIMHHALIENPGMTALVGVDHSGLLFSRIALGAGLLTKHCPALLSVKAV